MNQLETARPNGVAIPNFNISVNRSLVGKIPKDAPVDVWRRFNGQFQGIETDLQGLVQTITAGHAFTVALDGYRKRDNFVSART